MSRGKTSLGESMYCEHCVMISDITDSYEISPEAAEAFLMDHEGDILNSMSDAADNKVYELLRKQGVSFKD